MISDYRRVALDTLAAIAGYEVSVVPAPAPVASPLRIYVQPEQPEETVGLWVSDTAATGEVYVLPELPTRPTGEAWTQAEPLSAGRGYHASEAIGGKVYIISGMKTSGQTTECCSYDTATGVCSVIAPLPESRTWAQCVTDGKALYMLHGYSSGQEEWYMYSPELDSWTQVAKWSATRATSYGAALLNGKIYVTGGNGAPQAFWQFDIESGSFTQLSNMPVGRYEHACEAVSGDLYVALGRTSSTYLQNCYRYSEETATWSECAAPPGTMTSCRGASFGGSLYTVGTPRTTGGSDLLVYNAQSDEWSEGAPTGMSNMTQYALAQDGGSLWLTGGSSTSDGSYSATVYRLELVPSTEWLTGEVVVVCSPAKGSFSIAENCDIPLAAVYISEDGKLRDAACSVGNGTEWQTWGTDA